MPLPITIPAVWSPSPPLMSLQAHPTTTIIQDQATFLARLMAAKAGCKLVAVDRYCVHFLWEQRLVVQGATSSLSARTAARCTLMFGASLTGRKRRRLSRVKDAIARFSLSHYLRIPWSSARQLEMALHPPREWRLFIERRR